MGSTSFGKGKGKRKRKDRLRRPNTEDQLASEMKDKLVLQQKNTIESEDLEASSSGVRNSRGPKQEGSKDDPDQLAEEYLSELLSKREGCIVTLKGGEMEQGDDEEAAKKEFIAFLENVYGSDYAPEMFQGVHHFRKRKFKCMLSYNEIAKLIEFDEVEEAEEVADRPSVFEFC